MRDPTMTFLSFIIKEHNILFLTEDVLNSIMIWQVVNEKAPAVWQGLWGALMLDQSSNLS